MSWRERAACRGKPTEWWFPDRTDDISAAVAICASCPVRRECLAFAETELAGDQIRFGIWGGLSAKRRLLGRTHLPAVLEALSSGDALDSHALAERTGLKHATVLAVVDYGVASGAVAVDADEGGHRGRHLRGIRATGAAHQRRVTKTGRFLAALADGRRFADTAEIAAWLGTTGDHAAHLATRYAAFDQDGPYRPIRNIRSRTEEAA